MIMSTDNRDGFLPQVLGAQQHQVRGYHYRDEARLLPEATPQRHAGLRLHPSGDRGPECLWGCCPRHQQVSRLDVMWCRHIQQCVNEVWTGENVHADAPLCVFHRGHTVRAVCESFHLAKDAGFKVVAHMMPDLPNVGMERDVEQFIVSIFCCCSSEASLHSSE